MNKSVKYLLDSVHAVASASTSLSAPDVELLSQAQEIDFDVTLVPQTPTYSKSEPKTAHYHYKPAVRVRARGTIPHSSPPYRDSSTTGDASSEPNDPLYRVATRISSHLATKSGESFFKGLWCERNYHNKLEEWAKKIGEYVKDKASGSDITVNALTASEFDVPFGARLTTSNDNGVEHVPKRVENTVDMDSGWPQGQAPGCPQECMCSHCDYLTIVKHCDAHVHSMRTTGTDGTTPTVKTWWHTRKFQFFYDAERYFLRRLNRPREEYENTINTALAKAYRKLSPPSSGNTKTYADLRNQAWINIKAEEEAAQAELGANVVTSVTRDDLSSIYCRRN